MKPRHRDQLLFLVLVAALFGWVAIHAQGFHRTARIFPQVVAIAMLVLALIELVSYGLGAWREARHGVGPKGPVEEDGPSLWDGMRQVGPYIVWILAYFLGIYLVGFVVASGVFVALSLMTMGRMRWYAAIGSTAVLIAGLLVLANALTLQWPAGIWFTWP